MKRTAISANHRRVEYSWSFNFNLLADTALSLGAEYVAEGTELICDNWIREADEDYLPGVKAGLIRRYLYQLHID